MWRKLLLSFFGLGYGPIAPGTWGSLGAIVVYLALWYTVGVPWWGLAALIVVAGVVNVTLGEWAVEYYRNPDPKPVVIDEAAGMWLSLFFVPVPGPAQNGFRGLCICAAAFFLFRLLDILKLPPARQLERLPAGVGILCDDLAAGIQANIVLQVIFRLL
jgi:phosphatidylglycerophosphatase A